MSTVSQTLRAATQGCFLNVAFLLGLSGVPLISRREPLGQDEVQVLTNVAHTWPSTTCPCSLFHCSAPFLCSSRTPLVSASSTSRLHLPWSSLPDELSLVPYLRFQGHFPFSLSCIGEGNGNLLQCSCLENPRDGGAWWLPSMGSHRVGHD